MTKTMIRFATKEDGTLEGIQGAELTVKEAVVQTRNTSLYEPKSLSALLRVYRG